MGVKKTMVKIARSLPGGALAALGLRCGLPLLPVEVESKTKDFVLFAHPQPMASIHRLAVPRKRIPSLEAFLTREEDWVNFVAFLWENEDFSQISACCNTGCRQEVRQAHFHLLTQDALREKPGEEVESVSISGWEAGFSSRGNVYMDYRALGDIAFVRQAFAEGKRRYPQGFSMIWR